MPFTVVHGGVLCQKLPQRVACPPEFASGPATRCGTAGPAPSWRTSLTRTLVTNAIAALLALPLFAAPAAVQEFQLEAKKVVTNRTACALTVVGDGDVMDSRGEIEMTRFAMMIPVAILCYFGAVSTAFAQGTPLERRLVQLSVPEDGLITGVSGQPGGTATIFGPQDLSDAAGGFFPENMSYNVRALACRTAFYTPGLSLSAAANESYAIYLTIGAGLPMKIQTFNTGCVYGGVAGFALTGSFSSFGWLQGTGATEALPGLFTEDITVKVVLEGFFGDEIVLSGTGPAPNN